MPRVIQTPSAVRDLLAIGDWIAEHNLGAACDFYDDVDRVLKLLSQHPLLGEAVDDLAPGVRRHSLGTYLLFYRPLSDGVELIRVLHGSRDIDNLSQ